MQNGIIRSIPIFKNSHEPAYLSSAQFGVNANLESCAFLTMNRPTINLSPVNA